MILRMTAAHETIWTARIRKKSATVEKPAIRSRDTRATSVESIRSRDASKNRDANKRQQGRLQQQSFCGIRDKQFITQKIVLFSPMDISKPDSYVKSTSTVASPIV